MLVQNPTVPDDAAVVIVAGPQSDYLAPEIDALRAYLNKGGKVLFMLDPPDVVDAPPLTNLIALIKEWGIDVGDNVVIDRSGIGQIVGRGPGMPIAIDYPPHPITERFNSIMTGFPLVRSVTPSAAAPSGRTAQTIVETSKASWAESDVKALAERRPVGFDEASGDKQGPISLAAVIATDAPDQPPAPAPGTNGGAAGTEADARGRVRRLRLPGQRQSRGAGQREPVPQHGELARAAGQPDLDPSEAARRSARHVDAGAALVGDALLGHLPARRGGGRRASTRGGGDGNMQRGRNLLILLVLGLGLGAYVYFVEMKREPIVRDGGRQRQRQRITSRRSSATDSKPRRSKSCA